MVGDDVVRERLVRLMGMSQSGRPDEALVELRSVLASGRRATPERAVTLYVAAIASLECGDLSGCRRTLDDLCAVAETIDEPGWRCCALSLHVVVASRSEEQRGVVEHLIGAEHALRETVSPAVRAWATCGLGWAYLSMQYYELAIEPATEATTIDDDVLGLPESAVIDLTNLAEAHLRNAMELERLGLADANGLIEESARAASDALVRARAEMPPHTAERWEVLVETYEVTAARLLGVVDPARARAVLAWADRLGGDYERLIAAAALTLVLTDAGVTVEAVAAGADAWRRLESSPRDDDVAAMVTWAALRAEAAADPSRTAGLRHAQVSAQRARRIRLAGMQTMRDSIRVAELQRERQAERRLARRDTLTHLPNRRALDEWVAAAKTTPGAVHLAVVDMNDLKQLNDTHGHVAGDAALQGVAGLLGRLQADDTIVARVGGDEFVVARRDPAYSSSAEHLAHLLRQTFASDRRSPAPPADEGLDEPVSVSVGAASTREGLTVDQLFATADVRMYVQKQRDKARRSASADSSEEPRGRAVPADRTP